MAVEDWLMREVRKLSEMLLILLSKATGITLDTQQEIIREIKDRLEEELALDFNDLLAQDGDSIISILKESKFNDEHLELFADLVTSLYFKNVQYDNVPEKAISIYTYIQESNKTYSIELNQKIQKLINL